MGEVVEHMLTKEDGEKFATKDAVRTIVRGEIAALVPSIVREERKDIRAELISIRRDLDSLSQKVENVIGYALKWR